MDTYYLPVSICPKCNKGHWMKYQGMSWGYESFICDHCGIDIQDIKLAALTNTPNESRITINVTNR